MKHRGDVSLLIEDRNEELLRAYDRIVGCGEFLSYAEIYERLSRVPSSRFWVTGQRAYEYIRSRLIGEEGTGFCEREAMYDEIERRVHAYKLAHGVSFRKACKAVVLQKAPRFYLDVRTIENIIRQMLMERRKRNKKRWKGR